MSKSFDKNLLEDRIKASLDQSAAHLDANTQARLQAIRRAALNQPAKTAWLKLNKFKLSNWIPAAGLVFCSVIAVLIILPSHKASNQSPVIVDQTAMLELLDNPDELDAISDPDFYIWIDQMDSVNETHHVV